MSADSRMPSNERISVVLLLVVVLWCTRFGAGGCEDVSGRQHRLQQLLRSLESYSTSPTTDYQAAEKNLPSKSQKTHPSHRPKMEEIPDLPTAGSLTPLQIVEPPTEMAPNSSSIRSYQDFYRVFYGSPIGVDYIRKQYGPNGLQEARSKFGVVNRDLDNVRQANDHFLRIRTKARCRVPLAQVVRVKDYYPDPSREYLPRCTLLHRCGDAAGCCDNDAFHCVPSAVQEVTLHFYTLTVGRNGLGYRSDNGIEKLLFVNHTSCHCQPINDLPRIQDGRHPLDGRNDLGPTSQSKCRECPVPFTSRTYKDGRCGCDCFDRQKPCLRIKRGRDSLSDIERRCVEANHCHIPDCEYGLYDHRTGYCPKRHDEDQRQNPPSNHQPNGNHRNPHSPSHRWTYIERD